MAFRCRCSGSGCGRWTRVPRPRTRSSGRSRPGTGTSTPRSSTATSGASERRSGASGIPREEIFVTTKWLPTVRSAGPALERSLERLGMGYVDLYLIHWPVPFRAGRGWHDLEELADRGLARAIGVSNYGDERLEKTVAGARIKPAVNQVHFSPFHYRRELLDACDRLGVVLESYSPLDQGRALDDPTVTAIAGSWSGRRRRCSSAGASRRTQS